LGHGGYGAVYGINDTKAIVIKLSKDMDEFDREVLAMNHLSQSMKEPSNLISFMKHGILDNGMGYILLPRARTDLRCLIDHKTPLPIEVTSVYERDDLREHPTCRDYFI